MSKNADKYHLLIENLPSAFAYHRVIYDQRGEPTDYVFLEVNRAFEAMTGLLRKDIIGRKASEVLPGLRESNFDWIDTYGRLAGEGGTICFESYSETLQRYYEVTAYSYEKEHFITVFRDTSGDRQRTNELLINQNRLSQAQLFAGMGTWEYTLADGKLYWSDECAKLFAITPGEFTGDFEAFLAHIHPDDREYVMKVNRPLVEFKEGMALHYEHRIVRKDGAVRWVREEAGPIMDEDGKIIKIVGMVIDITENHEAASRLREVNEQLDGILESQQALIVKVSLDGRFLYVNDAYCKKFGRDREDLLGSFFTPLVHPDDLESTLQIMKGLYRDPYRAYMEQRAMTVEGWRWIAWEDSAIQDESGKVIEIQGVGRDITAQKDAEAELKTIHADLENMVKERTRELEARNLDLLHEIRKREMVEGDLRYQNDQMKLLLEVSRAVATERETTLLPQVIVDNITKLTRLKSAALYLVSDNLLHLEATHPPLPPEFPEPLRLAPMADHPHIVRSTGTRQPVVLADSRAAKLTAAEKEVCDLRQLRSLLYLPLVYQSTSIGVLIVGSVNLIHEFTEEEISICQTLANHAALALTETLQTERLKAILENSPSLICEFDLNGRYIQANSAVASLLGMKAPALIGCSFSDLFPPETVDIFMKRIHRVQETGQPLSIDDYLRVGEKELFFLTTLFPLLNSVGGIRSVGVIAHDITSLKKTESKLTDTLAKYRKGLEGIILSMGTLMSKRDNYTAEHQLRVTHLAVAIAEELGLEETRIEGIKYAAAVHDIGKIGIPAEILTKPGELTDLEYKIMQIHPRTGYEILHNIEFPWPLAEIVAQHHEKVDGSGYPEGLFSDDILLEAKIICVVDVVEAMASHRPYRPSRGLDAALEEIERQRGILFDDSVVDACLKLFREKGYQWSSKQ